MEIEVMRQKITVTFGDKFRRDGTVKPNKMT